MTIHKRGHRRVLFTRNEAEARFYRLQSEWEQWPENRNLISEQVELHPEWGIRVEGSELRLILSEADV